MTALRIELRRTPLRAVVALVPLHLWLAAEMVGWAGPWVWSDVVAGIVASLILVAPAAGGIAAFATTRERRRRAGHLRVLGGRHAAVPAVMEWAAVAIWALASYAAVAVVALVVAVANDPWGPLPGWWLAAGAGGTVLAVTLGWCAGRWFPYPWTAPVVATGLYLSVATNLLFYGSWWYGLIPGGSQNGSVSSVLNTALFRAQLVWFLAVAAVLVLAWSVWRCRPRGAPLVAAFVGCSLVAGVAGAAVAAEDGRYFGGDRPFTYRCAGQQPEVCIHPAFADGHDEVQAAFTALHRKVVGSSVEFVRVEQMIGRYGTRVLPAQPRFHLGKLAPGFPRRAVVSYVDQLLGRNVSCASTAQPESREQSGLRRIVRAWLADSPSLGPLQDPRVKEAYVREPGVDAAVDSFSALSEQEKRSWFATHYQKVVRCTLTPEDFRQ